MFSFLDLIIISVVVLSQLFTAAMDKNVIRTANKKTIIIKTKNVLR